MQWFPLITYFDYSRVCRVYIGVCVSVCFLHNISKVDAARITKLDVEMFYHESWKLIYFWVKRSEVKVTR